MKSMMKERTFDDVDTTRIALFDFFNMTKHKIGDGESF